MSASSSDLSGEIRICFPLEESESQAINRITDALKLVSTAFLIALQSSDIRRKALLMKLSEGIEWGLHCVNLLAALPPGATLTTRALAEVHGLSETYLSKHLQALTNANIIESVPGPKGGYRLLRPPEKITLLDVVEAIDGREPVFRCTEIRQQGPLALEPQAYRLPCGIHVAMARAEKAWRDALRTQTIADLLVTYAQNVEPEQQHRSAQWVVEHMRSPKQS